MGIIENAQKPALPTSDAMDEMPLWKLQKIRRENQDDATQKAVGPFEHQAFAREWSRDNPAVAPLAVATVNTPYTVAKAIGVTDKLREWGLLDKDGEKESPPSFEEWARTYKGIGQGVSDAYMDLLKTEYNAALKAGNWAVDKGKSAANSAASAAKSATDYLSDAWNKFTK